MKISDVLNVVCAGDVMVYQHYTLHPIKCIVGVCYMLWLRVNTCNRKPFLFFFPLFFFSMRTCLVASHAATVCQKQF